MLVLESVCITLFLIAIASGSLYWLYVGLAYALRVIWARIRK